MYEAHFLLHSLTDTQALAQNLAQHLPRPAVLALNGDLGAGKTTFTQALAQALGITDPLASPTFTLVNEYPHKNGIFVHADLYRLTEKQEIYHLGLTDYFDQPSTITVVEWAERFPDLFPKDTIWITLTLHNDTRVATVRSTNQTFWHNFERVL